jgi:hypothetical protein
MKQRRLGKGQCSHWPGVLGAIAALTVLCPTARAQDQATGPPIACMVNGYDIMLTNMGAEAIPAGINIAWTVPFARREGVFELTRPLESGAMTVVTGANGANYLTPRAPCEASLAIADAPAAAAP